MSRVRQLFGIRMYEDMMSEQSSLLCGRCLTQIPGLHALLMLLSCIIIKKEEIIAMLLL